MLQFEQIKEDNLKGFIVKPIGKDNPMKYVILVYSDDELNKESLKELLEKLDEHYFEGDAENINFTAYFDDINETYKIIMDLYYLPDSNIDIEEIAKHYRPLFEEFYNKNKPYKTIKGV